MTILTTPRLLLRRMGTGDRGAIAAILQDAQAMYAYEHAFSDAEVDEWMERQQERYAQYGFGLWAVEEKGQVIGQCGITMQEYNMAQVPEIGYLFAHEYWHKGYATEAALACREYGFGKLHFNKLYSIIRDTNIASQNVARRMGMHPIDTIVKHYRGVDMPHIVFCTIVKKNKA